MFLFNPGEVLGSPWENWFRKSLTYVDNFPLFCTNFRKTSQTVLNEKKLRQNYSSKTIFNCYQNFAEKTPKYPIAEKTRKKLQLIDKNQQLWPVDVSSSNFEAWNFACLNVHTQAHSTPCLAWLYKKLVTDTRGVTSNQHQVREVTDTTSF